MTNFPRRAAVVAAIATATATAGAGAADAATPAHTSLSIRSVRSSIPAGGHDAISGVLLSAGHPVAGAAVTLEARPAGNHAFHDAATAKTGAKGAASFTVTPSTRTAYELVFRGGDGLAPSHSGIVTVTVRPDSRRATSLSIRSSSTAVDPTGTVVVSGVLRAGRQPLADRVVALQAAPVPGTAWKQIRSKHTGRHGFVAFAVRPAEKTQYRLVFAPHPRFRGSHSGVVTVNVRTPSRLTISAAATSIEPGAADTISGILSTAAGPVAGRPVTLLALPAGASSWIRTATATTASDGSVSFPVTPASTTRYVLVSPRSYQLTAARSAVLTVFVRRPSSLSIRLAGSTVSGTLTGQGTGGLGDRKVTLAARPAGSSDAFAAVATATTNKSGFVSLPVGPSSSTDYELIFEGGPRYDGCHSGVVTVTVA